MLHARNDYQGIQDTLGLTNIPENEPVFLFRAQDPFASSMLRIYADNIQKAGATKEMVLLVHEHADRMEQWQKKKAVPDIIAGNPPTEKMKELKEGTAVVDKVPVTTGLVDPNQLNVPGNPPPPTPPANPLLQQAVK
jgi:hypothetical protein